MRDAVEKIPYIRLRDLPCYILVRAALDAADAALAQPEAMPKCVDNQGVTDREWDAALSDACSQVGSSAVLCMAPLQRLLHRARAHPAPTAAPATWPEGATDRMEERRRSPKVKQAIRDFLAEEEAPAPTGNMDPPWPATWPATAQAAAPAMDSFDAAKAQFKAQQAAARTETRCDAAHGHSGKSWRCLRAEGHDGEHCYPLAPSVPPAAPPQGACDCASDDGWHLGDCPLAAKEKL
jgi:hypothetical protein